MASITAQTDALNAIFEELKSKNPDVRLKAALELRHYVNMVLMPRTRVSHKIVQVTTTVSEMAPDAAARLWEDTINRRLFDRTLHPIRLFRLFLLPELNTSHA